MDDIQVILKKSTGVEHLAVDLRPNALREWQELKNSTDRQLDPLLRSSELEVL
jgi:hypothetical protein